MLQMYDVCLMLYFKIFTYLIRFLEIRLVNLLAPKMPLSSLYRLQLVE